MTRQNLRDERDWNKQWEEGWKFLQTMHDDGKGHLAIWLKNDIVFYVDTRGNLYRKQYPKSPLPNDDYRVVIERVTSIGTPYHVIKFTQKKLIEDKIGVKSRGKEMGKYAGHKSKQSRKSRSKKSRKSRSKKSRSKKSRSKKSRSKKRGSKQSRKSRSKRKSR